MTPVTIAGLGRASTIPGAQSMATTSTADVIVFTGRAAAQTYLENADDNAYRSGRVVLSYGATARVVPSAGRSTSGCSAASWAERARQGSNLRPTA